MVKFCKLCGKLLTRSDTAYCSVKCSSESRITKVERTCRTCGKMFKIIPARISYGGGKYCSKKCSHLGRKTRINSQCSYCALPILISPLDLTRKRKKYCNMKCRNLAYNTKEIMCETCGKYFKAVMSRILKYSKIYCSARCYHIAKNTQITKVCEICKKEFKIQKSRPKFVNVRFCSRKCYGAVMSLERMGENSPSWIDGKSLYPYDLKFNHKTKRIIRDRDLFKCVKCLKPELNRAHDIHHIDFNKENSQIKNLVSLCVSCHRRAHKYKAESVVKFNKYTNCVSLQKNSMDIKKSKKCVK